MRAEVLELPTWRSRRERGALGLYRLMIWLAIRLGRGFTRMLLPPICLYYLVFDRQARRASRQYLTRALGRQAGPTDLYRHFHAFGSCVLDRIFLLAGRTDLFDITIHGEDSAIRPIDAQSGCILLGAHMGSFEALRAVGHAQPNLRVYTVMYEENARKINAVLSGISPGWANDIISLGRPDSFLRIRQRLVEGAFVGILADRSLANDRQVDRPFLGAAAKFSLSPFRIVSVLRVPVVLMVCLYRGGNRYDVHFETLFDPGPDGDRGSRAIPEHILDQYVARLEHYCRIAPYNWFNFFDVWR